MALQDDIKPLIKYINENKDYTESAHILLRVYEGQLRRYILDDLQKQMRG